MAKKKLAGYIIKWKSGQRWYVHVQHINGNTTESDRYQTPSGRNKRARKLQTIYPNHVMISKDDLKVLMKARKKKK